MQIAHQGAENLVGLIGLVDLDLEQGAGIGVQRAFPSWDAMLLSGLVESTNAHDHHYDGLHAWGLLVLQISTGKFFKSDEIVETPHRGIFYTNYRMDRRQVFATQCGRLLPSSLGGGIATLTCETTERLEELHPDGSRSFILSVGGEVMLQDFAAITSFALNITCTLDHDLTRRLVAPGHLTLGASRAPSKYLTRIFDPEVQATEGDGDTLQNLMLKLMSLSRKNYDAAMRAIRRYVVATHRISDDIDLAYALFVASVESLAQDFTGFDESWQGFSHDRRQKIDLALADVDEESANKLKAVLLEDEHRSLARRYKGFAVAHTRPSFFRSEAEGAIRPIRRGELEMLLDRAYGIRSKYVHSLKEIPRGIDYSTHYAEIESGDGNAVLTFQGLARLSRHVILNFIHDAIEVASEEFSWRDSLPGMATAQMSSEYWVGRSQGYNQKSANQYLSGFLDQVAAMMQGTKQPFTDMRKVIKVIERIAPGLKKPAQRRPMLLLHSLYNNSVAKIYQSENPAEFRGRFKADFADLSIELAILHVFMERPLEMDLTEAQEVYDRYVSQRTHVHGLQMNQFFENCIILMIASLAQSLGKAEIAATWVSRAVENDPGNQALADLETRLEQDASHSIRVQDVLYPSGDDTAPIPNPEEAV